MRVGLPLAKQWASLFLSGLKIISTARVNNDCIKMQWTMLKSLSVKWQRIMVAALLLCLVLAQKSLPNAASLKKRGRDTLTTDDLVECDQNNERVFAPIVSMTTDEVWIIHVEQAPSRWLKVTRATHPFHHSRRTIVCFI